MKILFFLISLIHCEFNESSSVISDNIEEYEHENLFTQDDFYLQESQYKYCYKDQLLIFGLRGNQVVANETSFFCPKSTQSCCTPDDQALSMQVWQKVIKKKFEKRLRYMKDILSFLMGYYEEADSLSKQYKNSTRDECRQASQTFSALNLSPEVMEMMRNKLFKSLEKMVDLRKSFFCYLCDGTTHRQNDEVFQNRDNDESQLDKFYLNQDFCLKFVEEQIKPSYITLNYLKPYLESFTTLMSCKSFQHKQLPIYPVSKDVIASVNKCRFAENNYQFYYCEDYCGNFNFTKPKLLVDLNFDVLYKFLVYMFNNRQQFEQFNKNQFVQAPIDYAQKKFQEQPQGLDDDFFQEKRKKMIEFQSDIVYTGGSNPYEIASVNFFMVDFSFVGILYALPLLFLQ